ncbi:MAG: ribosome small subunit-dependent GTPase A [Chloroflexi bacterium]|nr:ribosome small subunit-dependent GTPase A [Chloroflexota bacterium]
MSSEEANLDEGRGGLNVPADPSSPNAKLIRYGLTRHVDDCFIAATKNDPALVPGRVARVDGISTFVHAIGQDFRAVSTFARIAHDDESAVEPAQPTVGDWVLVRRGQNAEPDTIELVLPRTSLLQRKRVMRGKEQGDEQLLAANVSTVFIVQSVTYFNPGRLEREVALVWGSGSTPVVLLTKTDLLEDSDGDDKSTSMELNDVIVEVELAAPGVEVFGVSGITGEGTDRLKRFTAAGSTVVLIGASGVGKSTLVNHLMGEDVMDTGEIREADARGRHTTVTRQLLPLPGGGVLIDTPGIRTVGLAAGSEEALAKTFSEIDQYLGECKFRDCAHMEEPGCAIAEAIADGRLLKSRFASYTRMGRELEHEQTKNVPGAKTEHQRKMRIIARGHRQRSRLEKREREE